MKSALPLLLLATALSTSVFSALSAAPIDATLTPAAPAAQPLRLADNDHDEGEGGFWFFGRSGHHEGHDRHGHDDDDDDDHGRACPAGATNCTQTGSPAAAGTKAPPANGLFAPGAKPQVQTN